MDLTPEQIDLLRQLLDSARATPGEERQSFLTVQTATSPRLTVSHRGLSGGYIEVYPADLDELRARGLLRRRRREFDLTNLAFSEGPNLIGQPHDPLEMVENSALLHVSYDIFSSRHPVASAKLKKAANLLRDANPAESFTMIGHLCREATQEFAVSLSVMAGGPVPAEKTKTKAITKEVLRSLGKVSSKVIKVAEALHTYWCTVIDLAQRQEHGGHKEGEALEWEDARMLVYGLTTTMYELDRLVER